MKAPRKKFEYPIALLLVLLSVVPLTGAAVYAFVAVQGSARAQDQARSVDAETTRLVLLTELQTRLLDERNWSSAVIGIEDVGLTPEVVQGLTGLDLQVELEKARARVDELLIALDLPDLTVELAHIRAESNLKLSGAELRYSELEASISIISARTLDDLLTTAGSVPNGETLVTSLLVLESTATARQAISEEFTAFFSAQFSPVAQNATADVIELTRQRSIRNEAEKEIQRLAPPGSNVAEARLSIERSPAAQRFNSAVDDLILERLRSDSNSSLSLILADLSEVALTFRSSSEATSLYFELVDASGADVRAASSVLGASAERESWQATAAIIGLAAVCVGFVAISIGAIGSPVRRLADTARKISDGESSARFSGSGGSAEISAAGRAMNEAAANLELAEQQAKALSEGDLSHQALDEPPSGQLGASLQAAVGALASSLQDREEFRRRITHEATHDGLTQLANRNATMTHLEESLLRSQQADSQLAVLFLDLDGFKGINDNFGHHAGDAVLRTCARRLLSSIRDGDHVGRLGGDEFLIIADSVSGIGEAIHLAERLVEALSLPMQLDGAEITVQASIGISLTRTGSAVSGPDLLQEADVAVYKAKAGGRGRIEVCDDTLRSDMEERFDVERALVQAMANDEFELYYQPVIDPNEHSITVCEALIRWNRPGMGLQSPDTFIPFAERSELIVAIDRWVLKAAIQQLCEWDAAGLHNGMSVAVNISSRHLSSPSFVDDIFEPLLDAQIRPDRLIIEITESALLDDLDVAASKLQVLRGRGIRTAIDDFGTGYTSLAHLKSLPIDILKIDRSFTTDESSASLVKLIIDIGHLLGARITAEGIETSEQAELFTMMGTDDMQGYLFSPPVKASELCDVEFDRLVSN